MGTDSDLQAWLTLQENTLDRVHASWFPGVAASLVAGARKQGLGRRWLANRLRAESPLLFDLPAQQGLGSAVGLREVDWIAALLGEPIECAFELGAMVHAAIVRTTVTRAAVTRLRAALGADRYERVLTATPVELPALSGPPLIVEDETERDVAARLIRCGAGELMRYAEYLHSAWGESIRLTFERGWWVRIPVPVLAPDVVESYLRRSHV
jgi:hypothetical protein